MSDRAAATPTRRLAVVTCMDVRIDPRQLLELDDGEAHIIRNAGGVITDDVIRSLCLSQHALGTNKIVVMQHTDCGVQNVDDGFRREVAAEAGVTPPWPMVSFDDPFVNVRESIETLRQSPFLAATDDIVGYVYDVTTRTLHPTQN